MCEEAGASLATETSFNTNIRNAAETHAGGDDGI